MLPSGSLYYKPMFICIDDKMRISVCFKGVVSELIPEDNLPVKSDWLTVK